MGSTRAGALPQPSGFVAFVVERLSAVGPAQARRMFGSHGIFDGELIYAIVVGDVLYFKTDAETRADFEALGLQPFIYTARGRTVATSYFEVPPDAFEDPAVMRTWRHKALDAALRTHAPSPPKRRLAKTTAHPRKPAKKTAARSRKAAKKTAKHH